MTGLTSVCKSFCNLRSGTASVYGICRLFCTSWRLDCNEEGRLPDKLREILVCPLSKRPLRYDESTNELINDDLGVAYPIVNGIPNLVPTDGRIIKMKAEEEKTATKEPDKKS